MVMKVPPSMIAANSVVQMLTTVTGASATGTATIPFDDTIPQITEGFEVMTRAITPTAVGNTLRIDVVVHAENNAAGAHQIIAALFRDATAGALAASYQPAAGANYSRSIAFTAFVTAGSTAATTFRVRIGASVAGTTTFNGNGGGRILGGVVASSITVTELQV